MPNYHEVPVVNGEKIAIRKILRGDTFSLWEWMDHALSASSNAAASMMWREATVIKLLSDAYPPKKYDQALWKTWPKEDFTKQVFDVVNAPLLESNLGVDDFNVYMFFTKMANHYIRAESSRASPFGLIRWLLKVEQGKMVDTFSSLELKRMLYLTRRRVRYAEAPELADSALFFKTGSLFECKPEPNYTCVQYEGNQTNVLNALVEVETPNPEPEKPPFIYMVAVMSNELKKNAAKDHGRLASAIHKLILNQGP